MSDLPTTDWPPCPTPFNMAHHVLLAGQKTPDKTALLCLAPDGSIAENWTYAKLTRAVLGTATGLLQAGASPSDRVLLRLGNTSAYPIAYLAALAVGLVPVPTSAQLTNDEVSAMEQRLLPRLILQDPDLSAPSKTKANSISPETLAGMRTLPPAQWHLDDPNRAGYIVFTSGTSGKPQAVVHAHRAIWARGMMHDGWYGLRDSDRLLHAGAFNWTFTLGTGLMDPWTLGATAIIPAPDTPPENLPGLLARHNATLFAAAPGVLRKALRGTIPPMPDLRHALSAGEKLPEPLRQAWQEATGTQIFEAFGMSECSTFLSACPGAQADPNTLGRPQPGRRVTLLSDDATPTPAGETGIIALHRSDPGLMLGYLDDPDATAARFVNDWFLTGDLGRLTSSGDIAYEGRSDDMMNAGGFRVSPLEVETALSDAPAITQIGVTQVQIKPGTHIIAAFFTAEPTADPSVHQSTLQALATRRLARYKQPRLFIQMDSLPTSPNGKLQRRVLAALYEKSHDQT